MDAQHQVPGMVARRLAGVVPGEGLPPLAAFAGTVVPRARARGSMGTAGAWQALGWGEGTARREPCPPWHMLIACNGESVISSNP